MDKTTNTQKQHYHPLLRWVIGSQNPSTFPTFVSRSKDRGSILSLRWRQPCSGDTAAPATREPLSAISIYLNKQQQQQQSACAHSSIRASLAAFRRPASPAAAARHETQQSAASTIVTVSPYSARQCCPGREKPRCEKVVKLCVCSVEKDEVHTTGWRNHKLPARDLETSRVYVWLCVCGAASFGVGAFLPIAHTRAVAYLLRFESSGA